MTCLPTLISKRILENAPFTKALTNKLVRGVSLKNTVMAVLCQPGKSGKYSNVKVVIVVSRFHLKGDDDA
jgi:uncharacterized lipoprotein YmbA